MGKKAKVKRGKGGKIIDPNKKKTSKKAEEEAKAAAAAAAAKPQDDNEFTKGIICTFTIPKSQKLDNVRDVSVQTLSLSYHGHNMLQDTTLTLNYGQRYGLIGPNGCGKSTLLNAIGHRVISLPDYIDSFHLDREIEA